MRPATVVSWEPVAWQSMSQSSKRSMYPQPTLTCKRTFLQVPVSLIVVSIEMVLKSEVEFSHVRLFVGVGVLVGVSS